MDYANNNDAVSVRTVEPNRADTTQTESRLFGAYKNTDKAVRGLTPDSTPDAPLVYPFVDATNPNSAKDLNRGIMPTLPPLPNFIKAKTPTNPSMTGLYTPIGNKIAPNLKVPIAQNRPNQIYYQLNQNPRMYLPQRSTPYYNLTTQSHDAFNDYEEAERDMEYLRQLYPSICRRLMAEIEEECDKLEYEGSCMFDEYPDKITLQRIMNRIYQRVKDYDEIKNALSDASEDEVNANQLNYHPCPRCNWAEDMIRILFLNEIHNRRRRYRNRRYWFY